MKKTLLTIFGIAASMVSFAQQTPSPSWTITQNSNFPIVSAGIRYMDAVTPNAVWATGYDGTTGNTSRQYCWVTRTNNGGTSWTVSPVWPSTVTPIMGDTSVYAISNVDGLPGSNTTAWVGAYKKINTGSQGGVFKSTDNGATWVNMTSAAMFTNTTSFCNWVTFLSSTLSVAMGDPNPSASNGFEIWRSTNGGTTWAAVPAGSIPNPLSGEFGQTNIYEKFGTSTICFGTNKGRVIRSTDGGLTWSAATVSAGNSVSDIAFYDSNNGLAVSYVGTSTVSNLYNTTDGGATWNLLPNASSDPNYGKNDICGIPGTCWYASCGAGTGNYLLSFSMDNGTTWNSWGSTGIQYLAMDFVDASTGWAGSFSDMANPALSGWYKYNGGSLQQAPAANYTVASPVCISSPVMLGNTSTGNPCPTYTWTCIPPANLSSSVAASPTISFSSPGNYVITLNASNSVSTSVVSRTVSVASCLGLINNTVNESNFFVSPNPSKDVFNVSLPYSAQPYNVTVTNVLGSVVYSDKFATNNGNYALNLSNNKTGFYFLTIETNGVKTTKKIILE